MADIADLAQDHMERENEGYLARALKTSGPIATGWCHWCDERVAYGLRWCKGADCRDQYDKEQKAAVRNRGVA